MDDIVAGFADRPYYDWQIAHERVVDAQDATTRPISLEDRLSDALADNGIGDLYEHQVRAIEAVRDGRNVVLSTPTASGKSLGYTVPAVERAMDHGGRTLYIAPQNALIADQEESLSDLAASLGFGSRVSVAQYTGRLSDDEKRSVRDRRPTVLLTTPDMLHYALLPHGHRLWDWFFRSLETVVVDEVHEYRGVFGSHVSLVLRRLARMAERFDADFQYVACSATIGNPVEHASAVTGQPPSSFTLVAEDASAHGPTRWLLWNPPLHAGGEGRRRSNHVEARRIFTDLVQRDLQTLVFTRARQAAERYAQQSADRLRDRGKSDLANRIAAYQAALTPDRRRELEADIDAGAVRGVWSTNALELGVDIGTLDAVVLDGYPGTRMNTFQQAGRAGRGADESLVVLVAGEDQLDQYVMAHPDALFDGDPERAVVNPANEQLLDEHLACAARETWLGPDDEGVFGETLPDRVSGLTEEGVLARRTTDEGVRWVYDGDGSPQHEMSLRTIGDREVQLQARGDTIATLALSDALRDAHPGAIYHHQGRTYEVTDLDLDRHVATLSPSWADYYTNVLTDKEIRVETDLAERHPFDRDDVPVRFADISLTTTVTGYERTDGTTGETLSRHTLSLPPQTLRTKALYFTIPADLERTLRTMGDFEGGIHAAEHAIISMLPTTVLCDRRDVGGLSTPMHPHTGASTIFVYDGYPGGVGLVRAGYDGIRDLTAATRSMVRSCPCADGCPACVQSPQCGNANDPLDKGVAIALLDALFGDDSMAIEGPT
ncbi:DEAD/DEAH box helicase [Halanaeroarchaeum sulfurireducens]|uniref:ATP-dependent helicase n=1 Tax=Halanaeroarchaeum sulfurireducens TaxID=1604004 RepID=A0A0F7PE09_9EURY|nr:DEAD/DEAH box helicase [Halanaeroarchaeum sulfurireducens]AKH97854.1 ATP-dependent helicase [Halanaeroarchaeum sulfurireducens]